MKIYTGYYAKTDEYKKAGLVPISISGKPPDGWLSNENKWYKPLAPSWSIWKEYYTKPNEERYIIRFSNEVLANLDPHTVLFDLKKISCLETVFSDMEKSSDLEKLTDLEKLSNLNPDTVFSDLERLSDLKKLSDFKDIILLCYEKPGKFCHRHIVGAWLQKFHDDLITEY